MHTHFLKLSEENYHFLDSEFLEIYHAESSGMRENQTKKCLGEGNPAKQLTITMSAKSRTSGSRALLCNEKLMGDGISSGIITNNRKGKTVFEEI